MKHHFASQVENLTPHFKSPKISDEQGTSSSNCLNFGVFSAVFWLNRIYHHPELPKICPFFRHLPTTSFFRKQIIGIEISGSF